MTTPWRRGDEQARLLLDLAAGRPLPPTARLDERNRLLAYRHGLTALLAHSEPERLRGPALPVFARLHGRQEVMKRHARRFMESFGAEGIPATVVKGPHVAREYANPALRTFTDLDLLIRRSDLEKVLEVLARDPAVVGIPPKGPKADKREIRVADRSGVRFLLDLHWDLFSYSQLQGSARGATEWAWERAEPAEVGDLGRMWVLPFEARLAFLCTHALLDHRFRLILFRDLAEVADRPRDWEAVVDFARRWRLRSTTYVSLLMAARLLEARVPEEVLIELRPSSFPVRAMERLLPRTDTVRFDGHRPHPLNLAVVWLHDDLGKRLLLALRTPVAFPEWQRRVHTDFPDRPGPRRQRPSVAIVVTTDRRRGAEVFGERLRAGLEALGWRATLVSLSSDRGEASVEARPVSSRSPEELGRLDPAVVRGLRRYLKEEQPEVVLANGSSTLQYSVVAAAGLRSRPSVVYASIGEPLYWSRSLRQRVLQRVLFPRVDLMVAVSEATRSQLIEGLGVAADRVEVAHTGVPEGFFEVEAEPRGKELRLLFLGNLSAEKDPRAALRVLARLESPALLRFVGSGPMLAGLEREVRGSRLADRVEFLGSVEDVRPHLAWADLLVLTSRTEGLPGAVLEAAAAGVPAVAFDVGGTRETLVEGVTGILLPSRDEEALGAALRSLTGDEERRAEMGRAARRFAGERFTLEHSVARYHEVLEAVRAGRGGSVEVPVP